jgi:class 3 adenylate cyclase
MALHLKQRLMQIADPVLAEHGQRFCKGTGDGFLSTFPAAARAVAAALELEKRLRHRNSRTSNEPIHYRIAIHCGDTWGISTGGEDIHGNDVNVTFRIEGVQAEAFPAAACDFPRMDRLLCSRQLLEAVRGAGDLPSGVDPIELGSAALKGIQDPVTVFWLRTG